jgi:hypothetical protein
VIWTLEAILVSGASGRPLDAGANGCAHHAPYGDPATFISLREESEAIAEAERLRENKHELPSYSLARRDAETRQPLPFFAQAT